MTLDDKTYKNRIKMQYSKKTNQGKFIYERQ